MKVGDTVIILHDKMEGKIIAIDSKKDTYHILDSAGKTRWIVGIALKPKRDPKIDAYNRAMRGI